LDSLSISGLRQNLNELVISQEEETRELVSLGGQVIFQSLFDFIKTLIVHLEFL
jgi:hypothetical protein